MTDLELTKRCAAAMGIELTYRRVSLPIITGGSFEQGTAQYHHKVVEVCNYDPLHNDAQAMALVKRFHMGIDQGRPGGDMSAACILKDGILYSSTSEDLNRAICQCVAKIEQAKA